MNNYQGNYYNGNYPQPYGALPYGEERYIFALKKKELRRVYSRTAAALIVFEMLIYAFAFAFFAFLRAAGYEDIVDADGLYVISAGIIFSNFLSVTFALICSSVIFGTAYHLNVTELFSTEKLSAKKLLLTAGVCIGAANIVYVVNFFISFIIGMAGYETANSFSSIYTPTGKFGDIISSVILAPVFEEIFYRGIIFRNLCKADKRSAIFISAAIFGLNHGNPYQFLLGFAVGIIFAYADLRMNSIIPSIVGHIAVNSHLYIGELLTGEFEYFFYYLLMAVYILIGLGAFLYAVNKYGIHFPPKKEKSIFPYLASSVSAWIFLLYSLYNLTTVFVPIE